MGRAGEESRLINREADEGTCRPPWARDRRGHPADSDGGGRSPSIPADSHRTAGGKAFLGPGNRAAGPALVTMVTVTGLQKLGAQVPGKHLAASLLQL